MIVESCDRSRGLCGVWCSRILDIKTISCAVAIVIVVVVLVVCHYCPCWNYFNIMCLRETCCLRWGRGTLVWWAWYSGLVDVALRHGRSHCNTDGGCSLPSQDVPGKCLGWSMWLLRSTVAGSHVTLLLGHMWLLLGHMWLLFFWEEFFDCKSILKGKREKLFALRAFWSGGTYYAIIQRAGKTHPHACEKCFHRPWVCHTYWWVGQSH